MSFDDWLAKFISDHETGVALLVSTVVGVMAALGKAVHSGAFPGRRWWISRALVAGFFILCSTFYAELRGASYIELAFVNSLLNLMGFAAIEGIERRARKILEGDDDDQA